jgi:5,10-methenyltetrahydrofolate synthetase
VKDPKIAIREIFRDKLESVSYKKFLSAQDSIADHLSQFCQAKYSQKTIAAFRARLECGEAGLEALLSGPKAMISPKWCFPVANAEGILNFYSAAVPLQPKAFVKSVWNILEPRPSETPVNPKEISLILIPLVAFDKTGMRLGHGKGYYDRYLPQVDAPKIGVAFSWQESAELLPFGAHDCRLQGICTEQGMRFFT